DQVSVELIQFKPGYDPRTDRNFDVNNPSTYQSQVLAQIYLLRNRMDDMGMPNMLALGPPPGGTSGANLGTTASGINLGTVFEDEAARSIVDMIDMAAAPFTGHFQPDPTSADSTHKSMLVTWKGKTVSDLSGVWMLRVGDYQHESNPPTQF